MTYQSNYDPARESMTGVGKIQDADVEAAAAMDDLDAAAKYLQDIAGITDGGHASQCLPDNGTWKELGVIERMDSLNDWLMIESLYDYSQPEMTTLEFRWTVSRGRDSYGYNICSLYVDGRKVSSCNGGGYDMQGTALGTWIAKAYADRLLALQPADMPEQSHWKPTKNAKHFNDGKRVSEGRYFYGLTYHDPNYDPGKAIVGKNCDDRTFGGAEGETVEQAEAAGKSAGLERYQAFYSASSKVPTERHIIPLIDGACGMSSVQSIMKAIGLELQYVPTRSRRDSVYTLIENDSCPKETTASLPPLADMEEAARKAGYTVRKVRYGGGYAFNDPHGNTDDVPGHPTERDAWTAAYLDMRPILPANNRANRGA